MSAYHQLGNDSANLVEEENLSAFRGAILSPVNYEPPEVAAQVERWRSREGFETVFDPQLYYPKSTRGVLRDWEYFPSDFDTADQASEAWWTTIVQRLTGVCASIRPSSVCSPCVVPSAFNDDYYLHSVSVCNELLRALAGTGIDGLQTAVVSMQGLSLRGRALELASVISRTEAERVYLVFVNTVQPRRELHNTEELKGGMRLIAELERAGLHVLVGFTSADVILWKAAGASSCASGKFFNLRRFTPSRWEEPASGGGQVPYWFEESLLAFLRQSDVIRVAQRELLSASSLANPYGRKILEQLSAAPYQAWLALGWRQFLYWFSEIESRVGRGPENLDQLFVAAENNWSAEPRLLLEEVQNNGEWVRPWRVAVQEYQDH